MKEVADLTSAIAGGSIVSDRQKAVREAPFVGLARLGRGIVSFETAFVLFLFAGDYKALPEFSWVPVDLTIFFFIVSAAAAVLLSLSRPTIVSSLWDSSIMLYGVFIGWASLSVLWSSFTDFNTEKMSRTVIFVSWSFLGTHLIIADDWSRVRRFFALLTIMSIVMIVYWAYYRFVLGISNSPAYIAVWYNCCPTGINNYLINAYHAKNIVIVLGSVALASRSIMTVMFCSLGVVTMMAIMLFIGGRGPLLLALLALPLTLLFLLLNPRARGYRGRFLPVLLGVVVSLGMATLLAMWAGAETVRGLSDAMTTVERLNTYHEPGFGSSVSARIHGQLLAFELWLQAPIVGWGIGEYALHDRFLHDPHHLFLEVLMEQGLVGFCLLAALMGLGLVRAWQLWPARRPEWAAIALVLLFVLQLLSRVTTQGFLPDERLSFALLGLILGLSWRVTDRQRLT